ncbi:hypothetical protein P8452_66598 [Trifolium repens]|nr:hypothetical protein P8452_66598 [Trifolium repens]
MDINKLSHGFVIGDEAQELGESGVCNEAILSPTTCVYHSNSKFAATIIDRESLCTLHYLREHDSYALILSSFLRLDISVFVV